MVMSELGTRLREARVNKGYTLNTLQQMTKIQKKYLQALEEGRYDEIPGNFYIRAFVKQYADMVGLDGDQLLKDYESELDVTSKPVSSSLDDQDQDRLPSRVRARHSLNDRSQLEMILSYIPLFILTFIIILIIIILALAIRDLSKKDSDTDSMTKTETSVVQPVEPDSHPESTKEDESTKEEDSSAGSLAENQMRVGQAVISLVSNPGEEKTYKLEGDWKDYTFTLKAAGFVWLGIYEDGQMVEDRTVNQGESFDYVVDKPVKEIRLEIGYPQGGSFAVNGQTVEVDPSVPYSIKFIANDQADSSDHQDSSQENAVELTSTENSEPSSTTGFQGPAVYDPANRRSR